jgi:ribonuclease BN (tRNA processing enzyme)
MSIELCVLASGSSGNSSIVRTPDGIFLIDCGIGPRITAGRLTGTGVSLDQIQAICLTHLDRDHFNPAWAATILQRQLRVFCPADRVHELLAIASAHLQEALGSQPRGSAPIPRRRALKYAEEPDSPRSDQALRSTSEPRVDGAPDIVNQDTLAQRRAIESQLRPLVQPFKQGTEFHPVPGVAGQTLRLAHDRTGSHAFNFTAAHGSIGYATDLGHVPPALVDHFCGVNLLALECNYDPQLQRTSGRPLFLQNRITGGGGHLSNAQCLAAVKAIFDRCTRHGRGLPGKVVLLHRSRQCNCPNLVRELFADDARIASRLVLSEQLTRTGWIPAQRSLPWMGEQLSLKFG